MTITSTIVDWNKKQEPYVVDMVRYKAWKWAYTKKGYLFYERYIPEGMEADGTDAIRVLPLDEELRKMCEQYIEPIGYEAVSYTHLAFPSPWVWILRTVHTRSITAFPTCPV